MGADIFAELNAQISTAPSEPTKSYSDAPSADAIHSGEGVACPMPIPNVSQSAIAFPEIPDGWNTPSVQGPKLSTPPSPVDVSKMDRSERLETLIDLSLSKAEELLTIELVPGSDDFTKTASMQKDLVVSLLNTGVKVDENRFKKRQTDALTGILKGLLEREKTLGPLLDMPPTLPN